MFVGQKVELKKLEHAYEVKRKETPAPCQRVAVERNKKKGMHVTVPSRQRDPHVTPSRPWDAGPVGLKD
jgi:hypothetical protein